MCQEARRKGKPQISNWFAFPIARKKAEFGKKIPPVHARLLRKLQRGATAVQRNVLKLAVHVSPAIQGLQAAGSEDGAG